MNLLKFLIYIFIYVIVIYFSVKNVLKIIKEYKEAKNEKSENWFIMSVVIVVYPLFIYFVDKYDLATKLGILQDNSTRWNNFIIEYGSGIICSFIGAIVLILVTQRELNEYKFNASEDRRLEHKPTIKCSISVVKEIASTNGGELIELENLNNKKDNKCINYIELVVKNVGLDSINGLWYELSNTSCIDNVNNESEIYIEKNDFLRIPFAIAYKKNSENKDFLLKITIYYGDLLENYYAKSYDVSVTIFSPEDVHLHIDNVSKEKLLNDAEKEKIGVK